MSYFLTASSSSSISSSFSSSTSSLILSKGRLDESFREVSGEYRRLTVERELMDADVESVEAAETSEQPESEPHVPTRGREKSLRVRKTSPGKT
jgi:hypothetical protein